MESKRKAESMEEARARHDAPPQGLPAKRERLDGALVIALSRSYEIAHRESRRLVAEYGLTLDVYKRQAEELFE